MKRIKTESEREEHVIYMIMKHVVKPFKVFNFQNKYINNNFKNLQYKQI